MKSIQLIFFLATIYISAFAQEEFDLELWYTKPAVAWEEALPLGNGKLGAMVYEGIKTEHFSLNDNTLWSGAPIEVARSVEILERNNALPENFIAPIKVWFNEFVAWLTTHPYGIDEMNTKNNHTTCYVMQVGAFARLTGNAQVLELCRNRFKEILLPDR